MFNVHIKLGLSYIVKILSFDRTKYLLCAFHHFQYRVLFQAPRPAVVLFEKKWVILRQPCESILRNRKDGCNRKKWPSLPLLL